MKVPTAARNENSQSRLAQYSEATFRHRPHCPPPCAAVVQCRWACLSHPHASFSALMTGSTALLVPSPTNRLGATCSSYVLEVFAWRRLCRRLGHLIDTAGNVLHVRAPRELPPNRCSHYNDFTRKLPAICQLENARGTFPEKRKGRQVCPPLRNSDNT